MYSETHVVGATSEFINISSSLPDQGGMLTISGLLPSVTYTVQFAVINRVGVGDETPGFTVLTHSKFIKPGYF